MTPAELVHKYMREHVEAHFHGFEVTVATNPAEQWVAILWHQHEVIGATFIAQMDGEEGPLRFVLKHGSRCDEPQPPFPDAFDVTLTDEQLMEISRAADGNEFAASPQEGDEATMASDAWQLLEVLSSDTAEYLIERDKMGPEIETITAREIIEAIARKGR